MAWRPTRPPSRGRRPAEDPERCQTFAATPRDRRTPGRSRAKQVGKWASAVAKSADECTRISPDPDAVTLFEEINRQRLMPAARVTLVEAGAIAELSEEIEDRSSEGHREQASLTVVVHRHWLGALQAASRRDAHRKIVISAVDTGRASHAPSREEA